MAGLAAGLGTWANSSLAATKVAQREFPVGEFRSVRILLTCNAVLAPAGKARVDVSAEAHVLDRIRIKVERGVLIVDSQGSFSTQAPVQVRIAFANLDQLQAEGASQVKLNSLRATHLKLQIADSASLEARDLDLTSVSVNAEGAGNALLAGRARKQDLSATGSGDVLASALAGEQALVRAGGASTIEVAVSGQLDVTVDGSGTVRYKGRPRISRKIDDAGTLESMQ